MNARHDPATPHACCARGGADATVEGGASASGDPSDFSFSIVATIAPEGVPAS